MFQITLEWLNDYQTKGGGYSRAQTDAVGVTWPLEAGWKFSLVGKMISQDQRRQFEEGRHVFVTGRSRRRATARLNMNLFGDG